MIGIESEGENLNLLIGDQILFAIGYAGVLYSGYTLVLDLYVSSDTSRTPGNAYNYFAEEKKKPTDHLDRSHPS